MSAQDIVDRVRRAVEQAAGKALADGRASVSLEHMECDMDADGPYFPTVVLTPRNRRAAELRVEVQGESQWWVTAGEGPGTELYPKMPQDREELLASLVAAVLAGGYSHRTGARRGRGGRGITWAETFECDFGPFETVHHIHGPPETLPEPNREWRFEPY